MEKFRGSLTICAEHLGHKTTVFSSSFVATIFILSCSDLFLNQSIEVTE